MAFEQRRQHHQRGSISILSVLWCACTAGGIAVISQATHVVQQRALAQESADVIALAAVNRGIDTAHQLEKLLHVTVLHLTVTGNEAQVRVAVGPFVATSSAVSATRSGAG